MPRAFVQGLFLTILLSLLSAGDGLDADHTQALQPDTLQPDSLSPDSLIATPDSLLDSLALAAPDSLPAEPKEVLRPIHLFGLAYDSLRQRTWVFGDSGLVARRDTSDWEILELDTLITWKDGCFSGGQLCLIGSGSTFLRIDGKDSLRWRRLDTLDVLNALAMNPDGTGLLVGEEGRIFRTSDTGVSWEPVVTDFPVRWYDVAALDAGWVLAGAGGVLATLDNEGTLNQLPTGTMQPLRSLFVQMPYVFVGFAGGWLQVQPDSRVVEQHLIDEPGEVVYGFLMQGPHLSMYTSRGRLIDIESDSPQYRYLTPGRAINDLIALPGTSESPVLVLAGSFLSVSELSAGVLTPLPLLQTHVIAVEAAPDSLLATPTTTNPDTLIERAAIAGADSAAQISGTVPATNPDSTVWLFDFLCDVPIGVSANVKELMRKSRQLNDYLRLNVSGSVGGRLVVSRQGEILEWEVLSETPAGIGFRDTAERILSSLEFTPAQIGGYPVDAYTYLEIPILASGEENWDWVYMNDEISGPVKPDSSVIRFPQIIPSVRDQLDYLVFPRKARKYVWDGTALVETFIDRTGELMSAEILHERDPDYEFGAAALDFFREIPTAPGTWSGDTVGFSLVQLVRFNQKAKKQIRKDKNNRYRNVQVMFGYPLVNSSTLLLDRSGMAACLASDTLIGWDDVPLELVIRHGYDEKIGGAMDLVQVLAGEEIINPGCFGQLVKKSLLSPYVRGRDNTSIRMDTVRVKWLQPRSADINFDGRQEDESLQPPQQQAGSSVIETDRLSQRQK